jgi:hypothetical protein
LPEQYDDATIWKPYYQQDENDAMDSTWHSNWNDWKHYKHKAVVVAAAAVTA